MLARQYLGAKTSYRLALESGLELRAEDAAAAAFAQGETVQLIVDAASRVVPA